MFNEGGKGDFPFSIRLRRTSFQFSILPQEHKEMNFNKTV